MALRMQVARTVQLGFKPYRHCMLRRFVADKHTSAATDEFKENKHATNVDESLKVAQRKNQTAIDTEIIKLESKLLKEVLLTKDALIHSKDALIDSKNALIQSKNSNLEKEMIIRGYLESELLAVKHKLHCRGVIERFEVLRTSAYTGQPKMTSTRGLSLGSDKIYISNFTLNFIGSTSSICFITDSLCIISITNNRDNFNLSLLVQHIFSIAQMLYGDVVEMIFLRHLDSKSLKISLI